MCSIISETCNTPSSFPGGPPKLSPQVVGEKGKVAKGLNIGVFVAGNNECVAAMDAIENFLSGSDFLDLCRNDQIASLGFVIFFWEMSG